ncbi:hypothetical protein HF888_06725 [Bermanella marisrubri]|uniref:Lipoprotein n=1 Tax=Bermanella marisrubri TaxID=207949 RepID=Q1N5B8_9GAMM|nr:hypothetical protein [Bermanella marisrubri]EAT13165.1 hypothetical protein RED65_00355 [Oceanobacter sp. RED65] [Bermanella marisrubri]QIZ83938.1 hypothetical protein HF888_06725 [Bermanella marisrubri]
MIRLDRFALIIVIFLLSACSTKLLQAPPPLNDQQQNKVIALQIRETVAQGSWLMQKQKTQEYLKQHHNLPWWQDDLVDVELKKASLAKQLQTLSEQAYETRQYSLARLSHEQALELNPEVKQHKNWLDMSKRLNLQQRGKLQSEIRSYSKQLSQAIEQQAFSEIHRLRQSILARAYKDRELNRLMRAGLELIQDQAQKKDEQGDQAYRIGEIELAIELWAEAKQWHPSPGLIDEKLTRAQKVLRKLDKIRQIQ